MRSQYAARTVTSGTYNVEEALVVVLIAMDDRLALNLVTSLNFSATMAIRIGEVVSEL